MRNDTASSLPKPVIDRIRRYAREGREPRARYGTDACVLMAFANGQNPVVILRSSRREFAEIRSAALIEWMRAARMKTAKRASAGVPS